MTSNYSLLLLNLGAGIGCNFCNSLKLGLFFYHGEIPIKFSTNFCLLLERKPFNSQWSSWFPVPLLSLSVRVFFESEIQQVSTFNK